MKIAKLPPIPAGTSSSAVLAMLTLWLVYSGYPLVAMALVVATEGYRFWARGNFNVEAAVKSSPAWILGISVVALMILMPKFPTQILLAVFYAAWRVWLRNSQKLENSHIVIAAVTQFLALSAIFLAAGAKHWPSLIIIGLAWGAAWLSAQYMLSAYEDRASAILSAAWALVVAECSWIFSLWIVNYIVFEGYLILPQAAIVLTGLGYCLGGIYVLHRTSKLSKARLVEYLMIGLGLLAIVIAGTKWNGII